jgi:hypothetical protein
MRAEVSIEVLVPGKVQEKVKGSLYVIERSFNYTTLRTAAKRDGAPGTAHEFLHEIL